jgi:DNA-binding MarR family transcriptional regulator
MGDVVREAVEAWNRQRPDLDMKPIEVVGRILRCGQLIQTRLDTIAATHGLSHKGDLDVLTALRRRGSDHTAAPSELARLVQLTSGGMTNRLDRLEKLGLVRRQPDARDRRGVVVELTADGVALADRAFGTILDEQEHLLHEMTPSELGALAEHLEKLLVSLGDSPAHQANPTITRTLS